MKVIISNQSELPIYAQIREQLKEQILNGQIPEGDRSLSHTRAYNELEAEGFIASMQGRGSVVLPTDNKLLREQCLMRIEEGLTTAIETAKTMGMPKEELLDIFQNLLD